MKKQNKQAQVSNAKQIAAAVVGNALEWYDFVIYGFLSVIISRVFFPSSSPYTSLLLATASFGVGFVMRPIGGILLGVYADRKGRKAALQLIIGLMTVSMALMAFTPTYASIGILAPALLVLARLLQGISAGGEFASATTYLVEMAPPNKRGFYGSFQMLGQSLAQLIAACFGAGLTHWLSVEAIDTYGFRVPFIFGLLIAPVGFYIRRYLNETKEFEKVQPEKKKISLNDFARMHWRGMVITTGLTIALTTVVYVILIYMPTYANQYLKLSLNDAFLAQVIGFSVLALTVLLAGALSDHFSKVRIISYSLSALFLMLSPIFSWLINEPTFFRLVVMQTSLCFIAGFFFGPVSVVIVDQFPVHVRSTGISIGYNLAVTLFGGFAPFTVTWLIHEMDSFMAPAYYAMCGIGIGLIAALNIKSKERELFSSYGEPSISAYGE